LAALTSDARANVQTLLQGFGSALNGPSTPAQDVTQDPSVRGLTGAQALNASLKYSADAFRASAIVNQALLGIQPHDLSRVVTGNEQVFRALAASGTQLSSFVTTFNDTFAARQQQLGETIALLPGWLRATNSALGPLDASFGPTRAFARAILPGITEVAPTIDVAFPWLAQSTALLSRAELGGLLSTLTPAVRATASTLASTHTLLSEADKLAQCLSNDIVPTGNQVIQDPPVGTGLPVYQELFQGAVGLAGASQNFDGNGRYIRAQPGGGSIQVQTSSLTSQGPFFGNAVVPALATRPAWPGHAPPLRGSVACFKNAPLNLNTAATGAAP
jgi:hypothetical protein